LTYIHEEGGNGMQELDHGPSYSLATPAVSPVIATIDMHDDTRESLQKVYSRSGLSKQELTTGE
jgi:hypothetical protein